MRGSYLLCGLSIICIDGSHYRAVYWETGLMDAATFAVKARRSHQHSQRRALIQRLVIHAEC